MKIEDLKPIADEEQRRNALVAQINEANAAARKATEETARYRTQLETTLKVIQLLLEEREDDK